MRSVKSVLLLALVVAGCSDPIGPTNIVGKWDQDFSFPGSFLEMDLTLTGSMISGGGNWCGEAGPCVPIHRDGHGEWGRGTTRSDLYCTTSDTRPDVDPAFRRTIDDAQCA